MNKVVSTVNIEERRKLDLRPGDVVRVHLIVQEIVEGKKADKKVEKKSRTRSQVFEGLVLARKHGGTAGGTFTVRKVASGVGVEKIFPLYSPSISKIEVISRGKTRRAKLYFIRDKAAKAASKKMRQERFGDNERITMDENAKVENLPEVEVTTPAVEKEEVATV